MKKRALSFALILTVCMTLLSGFAVAADMPFSDVSTGAWYYDDVKNAYELGLINGKSDTTFGPDDHLTYAEAIKLAACMHQKYTSGSVTLTNGEPWYQNYVDYAKEKGIISSDYDWVSAATRAGYMEIFAKALPISALAEINMISDGAIPDVPMSNANAAAIYRLYRAGIVQGSDDAHNCNPASNIRRSEVSAILTRMMDDSERIEFTMVQDDRSEPPTIKLITPATVSLDYFAAATFTIEASVENGGTLTYAWELRNEGLDWSSLRSEGTDRSGMDSPSLTSSFGTNASQYQLRCKVTNTKDGISTAAYSPVITVNMMGTEAPTVILKTPATVSLDYFAATTFTVEASIKNGGTLTYAWEIRYEGLDWSLLKSEGTDRSGMDSPSLTSGFGTNASQYQLRCKVTNSKNGMEATAYSPVITVNMVGTDAPTVTLKTPATISLDYFADGTFTVEASVQNGGTLTYAWEFCYEGLDWSALRNEGTNRTGVDSPSLTSSFGTNASQYQLRCKVTNTKNGTENTTYSPVITVNMKNP